LVLFTCTTWKTVTLFKIFCVQNKTVKQVWNNMSIDGEYKIFVSIVSDVFRTKRERYQIVFVSHLYMLYMHQKRCKFQVFTKHVLQRDRPIP